MKMITALHNVHKNKEIFIAGSDPTLEDYPDNFFDDKLSITLHLAHLKFPRSTYHYANEMDRVLYLNEHDKNYKNKTCIFAYPFYGKSEEHSRAIIKDFTDVYHVNLVPYPPNQKPNGIFTNEGVKAMKEQVDSAIDATSATFGGYGTCLHVCMYTAIMMGVTTINTIGTNFKTVNNKEHFGSLNKVDEKMRPKTPSFSGYRANKMNKGFVGIVERCNLHNILVKRYENYEQYLHLNQKSKES